MVSKTRRRWWIGPALAGLCGLPFVAAGQTLERTPAELTSEQVLQLETALAELNFDPGPIDGTIDERTRIAIRLYQEFAALPADGAATPALLTEVLSVARSFAEMRATRAAEATPEMTAEPAPAPPETALSEPALPEPVPSGLSRETAQGDPSSQAAEAQPQPRADDPPETAVPEETEAEATAGTPEPPQPAPTLATTTPETVAPPEEPEAAAAAPEPPQPEPVPAPTPPAAAAGGFSIDSVISRLVETGGRGAAERPDPAAPTGKAPGGKLARLPEAAPEPAPGPAPTPAPGRSKDGYAAFRDAYEAAQAGDFERAAKGYTDAIDSKKLTLEQLGDAHFNRANAFYFLGRYDKSIDDYDAAIGSKPTFSGAFYNRGFAHEAKGNRQRAIEDFRRARDLGLQRLGVRAPDRPPPLR